MNDYVPGELEHCVLSVIWQIQPCTAYQVRRAFQNSLTASWRASTGSIYPLLRKLVANGFVIQTSVAGDRRRSRALKVSALGARSLQSWLQDSANWINEPVADPVRTRSYVLPMLSEEQARELVGCWTEATRAALTEIDRRLEEYRGQGDKVQQRAHRGTQLQLKARLKWLKEVSEELG